MRTIRWLALLLALATALTQAQAPIAFDVASVKPNPSKDVPEGISLQPNG
jgi:hypothetical protein